jgi:hypothetical protein
LARRHAALAGETRGASTNAVAAALVDAGHVLGAQLAAGKAIVDPVRAHFLPLSHPVLGLLDAVGAHLLPLGHAILSVAAIGADLLPFGHAALGAIRPLGASHALGPLRHSLGTELLALHALGTLHAHRTHLLALRSAALCGLRPLTAASATLDGNLLALGVIIAMAAAGFGGCRRGDRQRGDAGGEE